MRHIDERLAIAETLAAGHGQMRPESAIQEQNEDDHGQYLAAYVARKKRRLVFHSIAFIIFMCNVSDL